MTVDVIIYVILGLWALIGFASGFLKQISHAVSLVVAVVLARPVGEGIAEVLVQRQGGLPSAAVVIGTLAAGVGIYIIAKVLFWIVNSFLGSSGAKKSLASRLSGAAISAGKAGVGIWLLVCLLLKSSGMNITLPWDLTTRLEESSVATWMARTYNPLEELRIDSTMGKLRQVSEDPQALRELSSDPKVAEFLGKLKTKMAASAKDEKVRQAARSGDAAAMVKSARMRDLLGDSDLIKSLLEVDVEHAIDQAAKKTQKPASKPQP